MSNFEFIHNPILQKNLDLTFNLVFELLNVSDTKGYKDKFELVSSFRKTIVIHTSSIIEALILYKLKTSIDREKIKLQNEWKYFDINIVDCKNDYEIICGKRRNIQKNINSMDFIRIIDYCKNNKIISNKLCDELHKVRELRNRLHIGNLNILDSEYTKADLEFVFKVAKEVKNLFSK